MPPGSAASAFSTIRRLPEPAGTLPSRNSSATMTIPGGLTIVRVDIVLRWPRHRASSRKTSFSGVPVWRRLTDPDRSPISPGTEGSNPCPSSRESRANLMFDHLSSHRGWRRRLSWSMPNPGESSSQETRRWREMDSNHRYPAKFFWPPVDPRAIHLPQYKPAPSRQGPMVRIHLPPAWSLVRTS